VGARGIVGVRAFLRVAAAGGRVLGAREDAGGSEGAGGRSWAPREAVGGSEGAGGRSWARARLRAFGPVVRARTRAFGAVASARARGRRVAGWTGSWRITQERGDVDGTLTVLLYSSVAALTASLGVLPLIGGRQPSQRLIGWANALAAGLMLGVAYALMVSGLERNALAGGAGAVVGIIVVYLTHAVTGVAQLELNRLDEPRPEYGYQVILVNALHAAHEGIAIGAAMAVDLSFGILMALALAVHNIPEATILSSLVTSRGFRLRNAALLCVALNVNQVLLAVVTFSLVAAAPVLFPWALGFAVGALIYLVMVELLPESYREAGHTSIALVTVVAMGIVVLLRGRAG